MTIDPLDPLVAALSRDGAASSDFDLNPDFKLPQSRKLRPAGVLAGFVMQDGVPQVILTKRSSALKHHPGQIAFPGGKQDEGDADVTAAALREAQEEVGLDPAQVEVLGLLPTHETVARVRGDFTPRPEPGEVAEVFTVPLTHFADPARFSVQSRRWRGLRRSYYTVPYGPYYIWGATARILRGLADRMVA